MSDEILKNVNSIDDIPDSYFEKSKTNANALHDQAFETKPVSYLKGAMMRFAKNKASIVAAIIILILALYAILVPVCSPKAYVSSIEYPSGFMDARFAYSLPCIKAFKGSGFWDGTKVTTMSENAYDMYLNNDSNHDYLVETISSTSSSETIGETTYKTTTYTVRVDTYAIGVTKESLSSSVYQSFVDYEKEKGIYGTNESAFKPLVDVESYLVEYRAELDANTSWNDTVKANVIDTMRNNYTFNPGVYYKMTSYNPNTQRYTQNNFFIKYDDNKQVQPIYMTDDNGDYVYAEAVQGGDYNVRVDYFDYFVFKNGFEPYAIFGTNSQGQDLFLRLAQGTRFSLILGVCISLINFIIGLIWGAISGYYGGTTDLIMERVTDIISTIPSTIILTICSVQFLNNVALANAIGQTGIYILAFLVAFVYSGWIGVAGTTRMQFYRYKGQEYVLASRTLGAKDSRLIFKHILPNATGTLVTSSVLMVPGVIFSESSLSYLGIVDFTTSGISSIGALLSEGQAAGIGQYSHVILFPCIVISLLMICFNLFGNGLRDAFNTSLKGSE